MIIKLLAEKVATEELTSEKGDLKNFKDSIKNK